MWLVAMYILPFCPARSDTFDSVTSEVEPVVICSVAGGTQLPVGGGMRGERSHSESRKCEQCARSHPVGTRVLGAAFIVVVRN